MKRVFTSSDSTELALLKNMLEQAGIRCVEINEQMAQTIPTPPFQTELWVENESDYPTATAIVTEWLHPLPTMGGSWTCLHCGEDLGGQFNRCWKCGTQREAVD